MMWHMADLIIPVRARELLIQRRYWTTDANAKFLNEQAKKLPGAARFKKRKLRVEKWQPVLGSELRFM